jgi:hypothetical protein
MRGVSDSPAAFVRVRAIKREAKAMDEQEAKRHEEAYKRARAKLWQAFAAYQEWQDDTGDEATFASWAKEEIPALVPVDGG